MASIGEFTFSKTWEDSDDFPTREYSESQVRADMQYLFDELKAYINDQVVTAINNHEGRIASLGGGGEVTHDVIADQAIHSNNIADDSIAEGMYQEDSIPAGILQEESVVAENFNAESVDPYIENIATTEAENVIIDLLAGTGSSYEDLVALIKNVVRHMTISEWGVIW